MKILLIAATLGVCSISSNSMAGTCISAPYHFHPALGDTVTAHVMTTMGSCVHEWTTGRYGELTSASIVNVPHNGKLKQIRRLAFRYVADKGFKGHDTYSISVCGKSTAGSGCSKVVYDMAVE